MLKRLNSLLSNVSRQMNKGDKVRLTGKFWKSQGLSGESLVLEMSKTSFFGKHELGFFAPNGSFWSYERFLTKPFFSVEHTNY